MAQHEATSRQMLQIIRTAFQCDLTRVATFQFANALSGMQFTKIIPGFSVGDGHHDISHQASKGDAAKTAIERFYVGLLTEFLVEMKNTPDGPGTSLLDNTLVFYFTEINDGNEHGWANMPIAIFGGKSFGITGGRHLKFDNRFINDVWIALANVLEVPMTTFGHPPFVKGPIPDRGQDRRKPSGNGAPVGYSMGVPRAPGIADTAHRAWHHDRTRSGS